MSEEKQSNNKMAKKVSKSALKNTTLKSRKVLSHFYLMYIFVLQHTYEYPFLFINTSKLTKTTQHPVRCEVPNELKYQEVFNQLHSKPE